MRKVHFAVAAAILVMGVVPASANFVSDGNFDNGTAGWATGYPFVVADGTVHTNPPSVAVISNPATAFTNGYSSYTDHTSDAAALMLFVDGETGPAFWAENGITLAPSSLYTFTFWATGADSTNLADVELLVNGVAADTGHQLTTVGQWIQYTDTFTSSSNGFTNLGLVDLNNIQEGNDFTVDDIDLEGPAVTAVPEPITLSLFGAGVAGAFAVKRKRKKPA